MTHLLSFYIYSHFNENQSIIKLTLLTLHFFLSVVVYQDKGKTPKASTYFSKVLVLYQPEHVILSALSVYPELQEQRYNAMSGDLPYPCL